jgi:hypothetical protein
MRGGNTFIVGEFMVKETGLEIAIQTRALGTVSHGQAIVCCPNVLTVYVNVSVQGLPF